MRLRNTIIVLVLLVVVGGYALVILLGSRPEPTPSLFKVSARDITHIDLRYPKNEVELARNPNHTWTILKPLKVDADQGAVDSLTQAIASAQLNKTIEEKPAGLAPFGLANPDLVVTIATDKGGALASLDVGKLSPTATGTYVKFANAPTVLMTGTDFTGSVSKQLNDLRSHELMTFDMDGANKILIEKSSSEPIEIDKRGSKWQIVKPANYLADSDAVAQLLTALVNSRIDDFVTDSPQDLGKYGLKAPQLSVSVLTGRDEARHSLEFGMEQPAAEKRRIYVKRGSANSVFTVQDTLIGKINLTVPDLRDKTVMAFDPMKVGRIDVTKRGKKYQLERGSAGKWQLVAGDKTTAANVPAVQTFLDELANLKGDKIAADSMGDPRKYGMNEPTEEIALFDTQGKPIGTVKLAQLQNRIGAGPTPTPAPGAPAPSAHVQKSVVAFRNYATSTAGTPVYSLREQDFSQFDMTADQFQPPQPLMAPAPAKKT
jgi:Domain of unknown function (DUF4340)